MVSTQSVRSGIWSSGTATAGGTVSALPDTTKAWAVNTWANRAQVRITGGAGAGQIRRIASNTATTLTPATAFSVAPDATSTYAIEGDDDSLYLFGNNAAAAYRYSLSANTWTTLAPVTARGVGFAAGATADLVENVIDPAWSSATDPINGRRIYSFAAGSTARLDYYDIAANTWINDLVYGNRFEIFASGTNSVADSERVYLNQSSTNRLFYFDALLNALRPFSTLLYGVGGATQGDKMAIVRYRDAPTELPFLYFRRPSGNEFFRIIAIK